MSNDWRKVFSPLKVRKTVSACHLSMSYKHIYDRLMRTLQHSMVQPKKTNFLLHATRRTFESKLTLPCQPFRRNDHGRANSLPDGCLPLLHTYRQQIGGRTSLLPTTYHLKGRSSVGQAKPGTTSHHSPPPTNKSIN